MIGIGVDPAHQTRNTIGRAAPPAGRPGVLSLRHATGFLALVENGSIGRAAQRLGIGQSTLSGHVKALEAALHHPLVERVQGGLVVTPAGWRAYARLRPLLAGASFALRRFRHNSGQPSHFVTAALPPGFPGTPIDDGFCAMAAAMGVDAPDTCFLVGTGDGAPAGQGLGVDYAAAEEVEAGVDDRWLLLHTAEPPGLAAGPEPWAALRGRELLVPRLSARLAALLRAVTHQAGARLAPVALEPGALLATARQQPGFCTLLPGGLVNLAATGALAARWMAQGPTDPWLAISAPGCPAAGPILTKALRARLALPPETEPPYRQDMEMLSLKHARSFLTLFEEQHVGRAARRLFVVQPALTMQLHQIEAQLGTALFERTGRGGWCPHPQQPGCRRISGRF